MATKFDPYKEWLGIPAGPRPPNHYQLLGLELFESEPPIIAEAAEERKEQLRALAVGENAELGRQVLEQVAAARKVLLSAATRREYDAELRQKMGMAPAPQPKTPAAAAPRVAPAATPVAAVPVAAVPMAAVPMAAVPMAAVPMAAVPMAAVPMAAVPMAGVPVAAQPAVPMAAVPVAAVPMAAVPAAAYAAPVAAQPMYAQPAVAQPVFGQPAFAQPPAFGQPAVAQAVPVAGGYVPTAVGPGVATPVMAGVPQASAAALSHLAMDDEESESAYRPRYRRQSSAGSWALLAIGFLVLAGLGAACFVYKDRLLAALDDRPQTVQVVGDVPEPSVPPVKPAVDPAQGMNPLTAAARAGGTRNNNAPSNGGDMRGIDLSNPNLRNPGPLPSNQGSGMNRPVQNMGGNRNVARKTPPPAKAKPVAPHVMIPSLNKAASADEKAAVAKSLAAVRKALGERNTKKAAEQLNLATLEASSPDSLAEIDRMKTLESALTAFWKAVGEGVKGLKTVDELNYDGTTAVVINADSESLSIRVEGQSKEYKLDKLPTGLAYHLAERWLREGDPQTKVILGAFLYVEPKGDPQKARKLWDEAANQGADVAKLLVQLDTDLANEAGK